MNRFFYYTSFKLPSTMVCRLHSYSCKNLCGVHKCVTLAACVDSISGIHGASQSVRLGLRSHNQLNMNERLFLFKCRGILYASNSIT